MPNTAKFATMSRIILPFILLSFLTSSVWSQTPVGVEFQVNTYTTSWQWATSIAMDTDGDFVVVWGSKDQDGDGYGVFGQRFASNGSLVGGEFQVNTYTTSRQSPNSVAMDADGDFVVVWSSYSYYQEGQDGDEGGVFGQRFASNGSPVGGEFQVNTYTTDSQWWPSVAMDVDGDFVVVWSSSNQDGDSNGIIGQRFASNGSLVGSEFQVNSHTTGSQLRAWVAMDADGDFVVVWDSTNHQDGDSYGVFGQLFASNGSPAGSEFQINTYTTEAQFQPSVAMDADGDFVVVWSSSNQDGDNNGVIGQRFASNGSPVGGEFQVNTYTTGWQRANSVAMDADGDFVVVWSSDYIYLSQEGQDGDEGGVFGQRFASNGSPMGGEFQVNTYTTDDQSWASVAVDADGDFVVVWYSYLQDGDWSGVFGQRFVLEDELAADFGSRGLWHYASPWTKLTSWDPVKLVGWQDKIAADFGPARGLWLNDSSGWTKISSWDPEGMVAWGDKLAGDFGSGRGLWLYETGGWTKISSWDPQRMVAWGDKLAADFGSKGLWLYGSAGWTKITSWDPEDMVAWGDKLAVDFGSSRGLWLHETGVWTKISSWDPEQMVAWGDKLAADFGTGRGQWVYDSSDWDKISSWDSYDLIRWGGKLAAAFDSGRGLWLYDSSSTWTKITDWEPVGVEAMTDKLAADFGSGRGLWLYETSWSKITSWNSEDLEAINLQ